MASAPLKALLVVDMQAGLTRDATTHDSAGVRAAVGLVLKAARDSGAPVVYVQHDGEPGGRLEPHTPGWQIDPDLTPREDEVLVRKTSPDPFWRTELTELLNQLGVGHIVVCGMRTEVCVDTTCRRGVSSGYDVTLVGDGHTTTADPGGLVPAQIIAHHNRTLDDFGHDEACIVVTNSADVRFSAAVDPELRASDALADPTDRHP